MKFKILKIKIRFKKLTFDTFAGHHHFYNVSMNDSIKIAKKKLN